MATKKPTDAMFPAPKVPRRIRIRVPKTAAQGDLIVVKAMIRHPMITGQRTGTFRIRQKRHILHRFQCLYAGELVYDAQMGTGIAADPYFALHLKAHRSGLVEFRWYDDDGSVYRKAAAITVT